MQCSMRSWFAFGHFGFPNHPKPQYMFWCFLWHKQGVSEKIPGKQYKKIKIYDTQLNCTLLERGAVTFRVPPGELGFRAEWWAIATDFCFWGKSGLLHFGSYVLISCLSYIQWFYDIPNFHRQHFQFFVVHESNSPTWFLEMGKPQSPSSHQNGNKHQLIEHQYLMPNAIKNCIFNTTCYVLLHRL